LSYNLGVGTISVVINTLNEEKNLPCALASVKSLADEIVVVDMNSDDRTVEIAKSAGAKVFSHERTGYVEPARNFAISKASGNWVLILDADEEIPSSLATKIKQINRKPSADYYRLPRKNIVFGKWLKHSRWWPDYNIRLFKKGKVSWNEVIHSVPMTQGVGGDLPEKEDLAIIHHHYDSLEQYLERMNRYTSLHSRILTQDGYKFSWKDLIVKPADEFFSRYFFGKGYEDGIHGLALSLLQTFSEIVLYLKVWQEEKFTEEKPDVSEVISLMRKKEKDLYYWQADTLFKESNSIIQRLKRKFRLR
jgi:(heptosyl)LPS beta-1,4-glucosyltransferase